MPCAQGEQWTSDESSETDGDWSGSESGSEAGSQADDVGAAPRQRLLRGRPGRLLEARVASGGQSRKRKDPPELSPRTPPGKNYVARPRLSANGKRIGRPPKLAAPSPSPAQVSSAQASERKQTAQRKQKPTWRMGGQSAKAAAVRQRGASATAAGTGDADEMSADSASDLESASDGGAARATRRVTRAAARHVLLHVSAHLRGQNAGDMAKGNGLGSYVIVGCLQSQQLMCFSCL